MKTSQKASFLIFWALFLHAYITFSRTCSAVIRLFDQSFVQSVWFVRHIEEETYQKQEAWELELSFYGFSLRLS